MKRHFLFSRLALLIGGGGVLIGLGSCDPLETISIPPASIMTFYTSRTDDAEFSCWPFTCSNTNGLGPAFLPSPQRLTVGFDYWYDPGTWPCNCWSYRSNAYRAVIVFDPADVPKTFVSATLVLVVDQAAASSEDTANASNEEAGTIGGIFLSTNIWAFISGGQPGDEKVGKYTVNTKSISVTDLGASAPGKPFIVPFPVNPPGPKVSGGGPVRHDSKRYTIDVTDQVRAWSKVEGPAPKFAFVFVGTNEDLPDKTNNTKVAVYKPAMEILYNPKNK